MCILCIRKLEAQRCLSSHSHMHVHKREYTLPTTGSAIPCDVVCKPGPNISPVSRPVYDRTCTHKRCKYLGIPRCWGNMEYQLPVAIHTAHILIACQNVGNADRAVSLHLPLRGSRVYKRDSTCCKRWKLIDRKERSFHILAKRK